MKRWGTRLGYGIGNVASAMLFVLGTTFLLVYYTNVAHISPGLAGSIIAISKLFDAGSDLLMGHIVDHTRSRFGKARPWLLRISIPSLLCLVATFTVPAGMGTAAQAAYVFITYNLFTTVCMTVLAVSYGALNSLITDSQYERGMNSITGMTLYTITLLALNATLLKICSFYGNGDIYDQRGWTIMALVLGIVMCVCVVITFLTCKEMPSQTLIVTDAEAESSKKHQPSFFHVLKALITNQYWVLYVLIFLMMTITNGVTMGSAVHYSQYILGDANLYSALAVYTYIPMLLGIVSTFLLLKRFGKRNIAIAGIITMLVGSLVIGCLPATFQVTAVSAMIRGLGSGLVSAFGTSMLQDTLTYGKWKNGFDMVGMGNAANSFVSKLGSGLSSVMIGWILELSGFQSMMEIQSAGVQAAIAFTQIWLPSITLVIALVCAFLYRLEKKYNYYATELQNGRFAPGVVPYQKPDSASCSTEE